MGGNFTFTLSPEKRIQNLGVTKSGEIFHGYENMYGQRAS
jgi:hypothetical protein